MLTNGSVVCDETGILLDKVTLQHLGEAKRVTITKDKTTIVGGVGSQDDIAKRCELLRKQAEETKSEYDREKLHERLAKLAGGVAVLKIGAATEVEMKEKKARVEDALAATKSAVEEGIVAGGGVALLRALPGLAKLEATGDEKWGFGIVAAALEAP